MIALQIINKVIHTQDATIIVDNALTEEHFLGYEVEFQFIVEHLSRYNKVPDKESFLAKFQDIDFFPVYEADEFLLDTLYEETLYMKSVKVVNEVANLLKNNANDAVEYLHSVLPELQVQQVATYKDIITEAQDRYDEHVKRGDMEGQWFWKTGLAELDSIVDGFGRGEELVVIVARTSNGKSWVLVTFVKSIWEQGGRVGYISPEMSYNKIGYRFDTVFKNFSNRKLVRGEEAQGYKEYIEELKNMETPFIVATPKDFNKKITIGKLRHFCKVNRLDALAIDGISYLSDERYKRGDNKTTTLANISEDLMELSNELGIPILTVVQANREGSKKDEDGNGTPELESIRDSDAIAHNATKVFGLSNTGGALEIGVKKHRDGEVNKTLIYAWDTDNGIYKYVPSRGDAVAPQERQERANSVRSAYNDNADVF